MQIKDLLKVFAPNTQISIEHFNEIKFKGIVGQAKIWIDSNIEICECEVKDNIIHIQIML